MPTGGVPSWRCEVQDRGMTMVVLNAPARDLLTGVFDDPHSKVIPPDIVDHFTHAQLELFLAAWRDSDGGRPAATDPLSFEIGQVNPDRLDAIERAAVLLGKGTTRRVATTQGGFSDKPIHYLAVRADRHQRLHRNSIERSTFSGEIWCPTTETGTWLIRHNGRIIMTGNSGQEIDADFLVKHVVPLGERIAAFLTEAYFIPALKEAGMDEDKADQYRLSFDSSPLQARTDTTEAARALWDRLRLSDDALMRAHGFDAETDRIPPEEYQKRMLEELIAKAGPQNMSTLLKALELDVDLDGDGDLESFDEVAEEVEESEEPGRTINPTSGEDTEPQGGPPATGPNADIARLIDRLHVAADGALGTAVKRASNRVLTAKNKAGDELRDRLTQAHIDDVLHVVGTAGLAELDMSAEELFRDSWNDLSRQGRIWTRMALEAGGRDRLRADEEAARIMNQVCLALDAFAREAIRQPMRYDDQGMRLPVALIVDSLDLLDAAR